MQCVKPLYLKASDKSPNREGIVVPCGRCVACRISKTREWALRLLHELDYWDNAVFVTLTYADIHLQTDKLSLRKKDLQDFFKRLRHKKSFKYYACGEYGENTFRPHYHAIVFGLSLEDKSLVQEVWDMGMVHIGTVTYDSCRYVAQYIDKKLSGDLADEVYGDMERPFQICSQGLGLRFAMDNRHDLVRDMRTSVRGVPCSLPQYYKRKLKISRVRIVENGRERKAEERLKFVEKGLSEDYLIEAHKVLSRQQRYHTIKSKQSLRKTKI